MVVLKLKNKITLLIVLSLIFYSYGFTNESIKNIELIVTKVNTEQCNDLWYKKVLTREDVFLDSKSKHYIEYIINVKNKQRLIFNDSVHTILIYTDSLYNANKAKQIECFLLIHQIALNVDGAPSEHLSDFFYRMYNSSKCDFFQFYGLLKHYKVDFSIEYLTMDLLDQKKSFKEEVFFSDKFLNKAVKKFEKEVNNFPWDD